ncbi:MAG: hypothetical protein DI538_11865 [Azospira oryzae]|jgi:hypothetical protein|nr:MAG: hypothetical protein DI538_11865 [Azospira oryzae]
MKSGLVAAFITVALSCCAQKMATTFKKAIDQGVSLQKLDSIYRPALSSDSLHVFIGKEKEFFEGYTHLLKDLGGYLKKNNFNWSKNTRCFNRIYLNKEGQIDYFLFNFKPGEISTDKEVQFEKLLGVFIQTYQFPLKANSKFAQCSPVVYSD